MRPLPLIREAAGDLAISGGSALLLYIAIQELIRRPGNDTAMLGGMVPVTVTKAPWTLVIVVVLVGLWLRSRAVGGARGAVRGAGLWLVRTAFWWSAVALALFLGVLIDGVRTASWSDLNWQFAAGYLILNLLFLTACGIGRSRTSVSEV